MIAKAGYSVYRAIKGLPVLAAEQESAEHPPLSERRIKLIDYALNNNLFNEKEKQEAMDLRKEIEDFVLSKKAKGLKPVPALPKKTKHSGVLPKDISS